MTIQKILFPLMLLALTLCGILVFQTVETLNQKNGYVEARKQQEKPLEEVKRVRTQVDALAIGTLKLSQQGNADALAVVDKLKKMGITINDQSSEKSTTTKQ